MRDPGTVKAVRSAKPMRPFEARDLAGVVLVAIAYFVTGRLGLMLADVHVSVTLIWAPTGVAIASLVLLGPRMAIGVAVGALLLNASMGTPALPTLTIALGNTLEALADGPCCGGSDSKPRSIACATSCCSWQRRSPHRPYPRRSV